VVAANGYLAPTLTVPPGALSGAIGINMVDEGSDPNDPDVFHVYNFAPSGTTFSTPATIDLPAPAVADNQTVLIEVSEDGVTWGAVDTTVNNGRASADISGFSKCRTRTYTNLGSTDLIVEDMVDYQDVANVLNPGGLVIPPPGEAGACYSGDIYGLCFKIKSVGFKTTTSVCPGPPTPTNPPPKGCRQMHVIPWQCYTAYRDYPSPFDPSNPSVFEGQHCDITGLLIPCADAVYNLDNFLPPGGLPPGQEIWVDLNFFVNPPQPANGNFPFSCFGSSFIGVDLLFREPSGTCAPGATCDWQAGIRSAKDGPHIAVPAGTHAYLPAGVGGCTPAPGATSCPVICNPVPPATTCNAEWDWLANHQPGNYPTLRFTPSGAAIKNWLNDARF
jgi:hypothetical protein